jgi:hypothetical protein
MFSHGFFFVAIVEGYAIERTLKKITTFKLLKPNPVYRVGATQ